MVDQMMTRWQWDGDGTARAPFFLTISLLHRKGRSGCVYTHTTPSVYCIGSEGQDGVRRREDSMVLSGWYCQDGVMVLKWRRRQHPSDHT